MYKTMQEAVGKPAFKKLRASQKPSNLENSDNSKHTILISGDRIKVVAPCLRTQDSGIKFLISDFKSKILSVIFLLK